MIALFPFNGLVALVKNYFPYLCECLCYQFCFIGLHVCFSANALLFQLWCATPAGMTMINKTSNNKQWRGCEEKQTLSHWCWECKQSLWERVWRLLQKLRIELPYEAATPVLSIYSKKLKTFLLKDVCSPWSRRGNNQSAFFFFFFLNSVITGTSFSHAKYLD